MAKAFTCQFFYWPCLQAVAEPGHVLDMAPAVQEMHKQLKAAADDTQAVVDGILKVAPSHPQYYPEHSGDPRP